MKTAVRCVPWFAVLGVIVSAAGLRGQAPRYQARFLGAVLGPLDSNAMGEVAGTTVDAGNLRGFVAAPGSTAVLLPLPPGRVSSTADDLSDGGAVAGSVGSFYSPQFGGVAAVWLPDGRGGYTVHELGTLPGHRSSRAMALNQVGDVVGWSSDGTFRIPVLFTGANGIVDLSPTGIFDPQSINDRRVLVDDSSTCRRLDLTTMAVQDLGVPAGNYRATSSVAINERGQVAGLAILTTSTQCDRVAARFTDGIGWEVLSACGPDNRALDMNDSGDVVFMANLVPMVRLEGVGTFRIEDLIVNTVGHWYVTTTSWGAIDDALQIAVSATNPTTNQTGTLLLTPERLFAYGTGCAGSGGITPVLTVGAAPGNRFDFVLARGLGGALAGLVVGLQQGSLPMPGGCTLLVDPLLPGVATLVLGGGLPGAGSGVLALAVPPAVSGTFTTQAFVIDPGVPSGFAGTNGWQITVPAR